MYIAYFLSPFIPWWAFGLGPPHENYEQCYNENGCAKSLGNLVFNYFECVYIYTYIYICRSGNARTYGNF